MVGWGLLSWR